MHNPLKHPLQELGSSRTGGGPDHLVLTPDTFVRAPLPGLRNATAIVHAAPANGAGFAAYTVEFEHGGGMETCAAQMFLYILDGFVTVDHTTLSPAQYAYLPPASSTHIETHGNARALVIEKMHKAIDGPTPEAFTGDEQAVDGQPMDGEPDIEVRQLLPDNMAFDFAVNTMTYPPGASLPMVESHVMEHGLLMLEGGGIYRLGDRWYPTKAGDFIWMAPFCAQWFGALGKTPAKYIIYKDWNRHPLAGE
jgi:(S)-ureidoglycine aminohydrolase